MIGKFLSLCGFGLFAGLISLSEARATGVNPLSASAVERTVWFDIPAQPLAQALTQFGEQAGQAALVDSALTAGRRSNAVQGRYAPPDALRMLIRATGLVARYTSADAFTLMADKVSRRTDPAPVTKEGDTSMPGLGGDRYATVLQRSIERALCRSPQTRPGEYRAVLQLWLATDGRVTRVKLLHTTGQDNRDAAIQASLQRLRLETVPQTHLAQPLTILLLPGIKTTCQLSGVSRH